MSSVSNNLFFDGQIFNSCVSKVVKSEYENKDVWRTTTMKGWDHVEYYKLGEQEEKPRLYKYLKNSDSCGRTGGRTKVYAELWECVEYKWWGKIIKEAKTKLPVSYLNPPLYKYFDNEKEKAALFNIKTVILNYFTKDIDKQHRRKIKYFLPDQIIDIVNSELKNENLHYLAYWKLGEIRLGKIDNGIRVKCEEPPSPIDDSKIRDVLEQAMNGLSTMFTEIQKENSSSQSE